MGSVTEQESNETGAKSPGGGGQSPADGGRSPGGGGRDTWTAVLKRTVSEFQRDGLTDWAAALTYYGILSIFPALLALVSVLGLIGHSATEPLINNLHSLAPGPATQIVTDAIRNLQNGRGAAGVLFVIGILGAIWSASAYVGAFMRASNAIYDIDEGRPIWKTLPTRVLTTVVLLAMVAIVTVGVTVTGGLASSVGDLLGVQGTAVTVWEIAKWPVILIVVISMIALLYWISPNVKRPRFQLFSPGSIIAVLLWIAASAAFAFYVSNFSSYNRTYGALGGVIVFLIWLWISNVAILLGAELNAEIERGRQIEAGHPEHEEPFLEPRDRKAMPS
jgi:membrane protein